ncbi:stage III sporulation protein AG [Bacillus sp. Marseille-P3661]|uniref:stage III sporulation protein AG n=1 Tax=Bacillus sp. Marseille-P3661 TaxID=1936234 RepID=UPI000C81A307|nr:stage III sporulation protein AG [Bacillus sp. Marseille-P3661]
MNEKNKDFFTWLKGLLKKSDQEPKDKKYSNYVLLILGIGIAFMLISNLLPSNEKDDSAVPVFDAAQSNDNEQPVFGQKSTEGSNAIADYEAEYENQLKETLDSVVGVEDVTVMVNLDATELKVYEKNTVVQTQKTEEVDREGGKRNVEDMSRDEQVVIVRNGEKETPITIKTEKPAIRGVLVVAKGVDNLKVKQMVVEAVTRVLDVPSHRVSVLPKKTKGE